MTTILDHSRVDGKPIFKYVMCSLMQEWIPA